MVQLGLPLYQGKVHETDLANQSIHIFTLVQGLTMTQSELAKVSHGVGTGTTEVAKLLGY